MKNNFGYTLVELLVVISIFIVLLLVVFNRLPYLKSAIDSSNNFEELESVMRLARERAAALENNSDYGIFFDTTVSPVKYVLYKGLDYFDTSRNKSFDEVYYFNSKNLFLTTFSNNIAGQPEPGPYHYLYFKKGTGELVVGNNGYLTIFDSITNTNKTLSFNKLGAINASRSLLSLDVSRAKDSRHLHFNYNRIIDTNKEFITFNYNNSEIVHTYPISAYINPSSGQLEISDTFTILGTNYTVELRTHQLNQITIPRTIFSIRRDRMYANKSLVITLSGDSTGNLVSYSANGVTTTSSSTHVSPPVSSTAWQ